MAPLTATYSSSPLIGLLHRNRGLMFPLACAGLIFVVLFPLQTWLIDLLLVANLTLAALILFTSIHVSDPLEFSVFPSLLLGTTLIRLVLNVATTRLILTAGADGAPAIVATTAAGAVISSFGYFVTSGSLTVGFVIFTILVVIQFVVITKGATRISEVAARFTLDSMPGKQMAVDADLNAGLIDQAQASTRRETITRESNFYGAMDGASKFVRGDAIAAVIITLINIIGGLCVGLIQHGWSLSETLTVFTTLTIGDGLVSQLPAFIIAISAGLIITRSTGRSDLGKEMVDQLFGRPGVLVIATIFLALLLLTGLPKLPLLILGGCLLALTWALRKSDSDQASAGRQVLAEQPVLSDRQPAVDTEAQKLIPPSNLPLLDSSDSAPHSSSQSAYLRFEPLEVQVGFSLLDLIDTSKPGNLLSRIEQIRREVANRLGFVVPGVFVYDNVRLPARAYVLKVRGREVHQGQIHPGKLLAVAGGFSAPRLEGLALTDPITQRPAFWIPITAQEQARRLGYEVFSSEQVLPRHLLHVVHTHAAELLSRQAVHGLLSDLANRAPDLVAELIGSDMNEHSSSRQISQKDSRVSVRQIHKLMQNLLSEGVPVCDLESVLEGLSDAVACGGEPAEITEQVRLRLSGAITKEFSDAEGRVNCLVLEPTAERSLAELLQQLGSKGPGHLPSSEVGQSGGDCLSALAETITDYARSLPVLPEPLVVLVGPQVRPVLAKALATESIRLPVLARSEILDKTRIHALASFSLPESGVSRAASPRQQKLELFS